MDEASNDNESSRGKEKTDDDQGLNPERMDRHTRAKLEAIRKRTPRYLYRLWEDVNDGPTGGRKGLNTTTSITPLAFAQNKGHKTTYHMTKEEFTDLAICHLHVDKNISTEFSSWASSFAFVMDKCGQIATNGLAYNERSTETMHVSVIDTQMLWDTNQAFFVPSLDFLDEGEFDYRHEYLVHGVIEGPAYKTIPFQNLADMPGLEYSIDYQILQSSTVPIKFITDDEVTTARKTGELFGDTFFLGVMLAALSSQKRERYAWLHGVPDEDLEKVFKGIEWMLVPVGWMTDKMMKKPGLLNPRNFDDARQEVRLMRALVNYWKEKEDDGEVSDDEEVSWEDDEEYEEPEDEGWEEFWAEQARGEEEARAEAFCSPSHTNERRIDKADRSKRQGTETKAGEEVEKAETGAEVSEEASPPKELEKDMEVPGKEYTAEMTTDRLLKEGKLARDMEEATGMMDVMSH